MSLLRIKWGGILSLFKKRFTTEEENLSPTTYFENEETLTLYMETRKGNIWCSSILKVDIEGGVDSFKREFLTNSIELTEPIKDGTSIIIRE